MQSSYTQEQEAQLTRWGCPKVTAVVPLPEGGSGYTDFRQPHDVLDWLMERLDAACGLTLTYHEGNDVRRQWQASSAGYGWATPAADPYAATFALAQAVMEAQERADERLLVADDCELADMRDLEEA